jgi:hypothetical protein
MVAIVLLTVFAVWRSSRTSEGMSAAAADEKQFLQSDAGTKSKLVVEVTECPPDGTIAGKLLQKKTEEIYARTATPVAVHFDAQTKIVMGKKADIHAGAVVHVTGAGRDDRSIQAEQIVILTGYVKVQ